MSDKDKTPRRPPGIVIGVTVIALGALLLYLQQDFFGWFLLAVGGYGFVMSLLEPRIGSDAASRLATAVATLVVVTALLLVAVLKVQVGWVQALLGVVISALVTVVAQGLFSLIKSSKLRVALKSLAILCFSFVLLVLYHVFLRGVPILEVFVLFFAVTSLRQALGELILVQTDRFAGLAAYFVPDAIVGAALVAGLFLYQDLLFLHLLVVVIVMSVFRFGAEKFIPEVAEREREKVDPVSGASGYQLFRELTGTHSSVNWLMFLVLLAFRVLSLDAYVLNLDIQSDVFQASIGLLGIVIGFSTLILGERLSRQSEGWKKQTYLLRGLVGVSLLFFIVAGVAFLARLLQPIVETSVLPMPMEIWTGFLGDTSIRVRLTAGLANEFLVFAVPAALLYLFSTSRDLMERYERIDG